MKMVDFNVDVAALLSAGVGAVAGVLGATFHSGKAWERVEGGQTRIEEKMTYICDELARRITVLENRVQYDGLYINRRSYRDPSDDQSRGFETTRGT